MDHTPFYGSFSPYGKRLSRKLRVLVRLPGRKLFKRRVRCALPHPGMSSLALIRALSGKVVSTWTALLVQGVRARVAQVLGSTCFGAIGIYTSLGSARMMLETWNKSLDPYWYGPSHCLDWRKQDPHKGAGSSQTLNLMTRTSKVSLAAESGMSRPLWTCIASSSPQRQRAMAPSHFRAGGGRKRLLSQRLDHVSVHLQTP